MFNLFDFVSGANKRLKGVNLPERKQLSLTQAQSEVLPVFPRYAISCRQRDGDLVRPIVQVGERVKAGQILAIPSCDLALTRHAPTSGIIRHLDLPITELHPSQAQSPAIIIESDGEDQHFTFTPYPQYAQTPHKTLLQRIADAGIAGMGGAGFPTEKKINLRQAVPDLIINGAECEPYLTCDDMLMREAASEILQGAQVIAHLVGAERILVGIESNKPEAIAKMHQAAKVLADPRIHIKLLPALYPMGSRQQMALYLLGKQTEVGKRSHQYGFICHNVATAKACYDAICLGHALISRYITLTGDVLLRGQVLQTRVGTFFGDILAQASLRNTPKQVVVGGSMMGFAIDWQHAEHAVIKKETTSLLLLDTAIRQAEKKQEKNCIRCGDCVNVCPVNLLPQQLWFYGRAPNDALALEKAVDYRLMDCIECGCCATVCPSEIPLVQYFQNAKGRWRETKQQKHNANQAKLRFDHREARLAHEAAEKAAKLEAKRQALLARQAENSSPEANAEADLIAQALARVNAKKQQQAEVSAALASPDKPDDTNAH